jgi:hypothetical protein
VQTNASGSTPSPRKDLPGLAAQPIEVALALHDLSSNRGTSGGTELSETQLISEHLIVPKPA